MRKIINGKAYDTSTATEIGSHSYDIPGNLNYICENLYRKKTGEYFLYGEGGANTIYCRTLGTNEWCAGENIEPYTLDKAKEWVEEHLSAEVYEEEFGEVEE